VTGERGRVPTTEELLGTWRAAAGSDADPDGRVHADRPPWDLDALLRDAADGTTALLDLGGTAPAGLDVTVVTHRTGAVGQDGATPDAGPLPFPERCVDTVLAVDAAYDPAEVARVLRPGGVLLAELRGPDDAVELYAVLGSPLPHPRRTLDACVRALLDAGLHVTAQEAWHGFVRFDDVAALVTALARGQIEAPADFSPQGYANTLLYLHLRGPAWGQPLVFTRSRLMVRAERPS